MSQVKGPACAGCALETIGRGFVQITPPSDYSSIKLMVQGGMPSEQDADEGRPFTGKLGGWLKFNWLANAGLSEGDVLYDNTIRCRPKLGKEAYPKKQARVSAEAHCASYAAYQGSAPRSVPLLLIADEAVQSTLDRNSAATWHGHIEQVNGRMIGVTYPPSSVVANPNLLPLVIKETTNLMEAAANPSVLARADVIKGHIPYRAGEECVVDLEWNYLKKTKISAAVSGKLTVVGIAHEAYQSFATHQVEDGLATVKRHLDAGTRIIGHNIIQADIPKLGMEPQSYTVAHVVDTMIAAHVVHAHWAGMGLYGLEDLARYYRPTSAWKQDKSDLLYYNGLDTAMNFGLWEDLQIDLTMTDQWHLVSKEQRLARMSWLMAQRGLRLDTAALKQFDRDWAARRLEIAEAMPFNPKSPKQILAYFAGEKIRLPKTGIEELQRAYKRKPHPMLQALIDFKDEGKGIKAWFDDVAIARGTVHPKFNVTGTSVARFSSSDPNFQNVPPDYRKFILPHSDDEFIASFDGKNIEGRTVAWNARDERMLADFASGKDIHKLVASRILHKRMEDVTKDERQGGKQTVHASNYLEGPYNLANRLYGNQKQESIAKATLFQQGYFTAYPRTREWQQELAVQMDRGENQLRNPFGRVRMIYDRDSHERAKRAAHFMGCSTGADVVNQRALDVWDELGLIPMLIVHDELAYSLPRGEQGDKLVKRIKEICDAPIPEMDGFVIPFGYKHGPDYGNLHEED